MQKIPIFRPGLLLVTALCFLLPFLRMSCGSEAEKITLSFSGTNLAFGMQRVVENQMGNLTEIDENDADRNLLNNDLENSGRHDDRKLNIQPLVLAAFLLTVLAFVISFFEGWGRLFAAFSALAAIICLLAFRFKFENDTYGNTLFGNISYTFLWGFWLTITLLLLSTLANFFAYWQFRKHYKVNAKAISSYNVSENGTQNKPPVLND